MTTAMKHKPAVGPRPLGFTLIELMITVAVVGILAALAYPSYTEYVRRGKRTDAKAVLLEAAQLMERNYTESNSYAVNSAGTAMTLPVALQQSPKGSAAANYTITLPSGSLTATAFVLNAAPTGSMASDACGTLSINQLGVRSVSGGGRTVEECWGR